MGGAGTVGGAAVAALVGKVGGAAVAAWKGEGGGAVGAGVAAADQCLNQEPQH